jgi:4-hydroxybenzoate polyprenyltransferase
MLRHFWNRLWLTLDMIRFEHSVFALPFALTGALLAIREDGFAVPHLGWRIFWIIVAMVAARSAAMSFNRILDAPIDARNPPGCSPADSPGASPRLLQPCSSWPRGP